MPHSSGGGSHGGGSHGGSHGGSSGPRISSHYFAGSRRYRRHHYSTGQDEYLYASGKPQKTTAGSIVFVSVFAAFMTTMTGIGIFSDLPRKLHARYLDMPAVNDYIDAIEDDDSLKDVMDEYQEITGICSVVYTVYDEEWKDEYDTLEDYAFSTYVDNFKDEEHWVFVYSVSLEEQQYLSDGEIPDYAWEAIQGDDTDPILTESMFKHFADIVQDDLEDGRDPGTAFENAFEYAKKDAKKKLNPMSPGSIAHMALSSIPLLFIAGIFVPILIVTIRKYKKDKDIDYDEVPFDGSEGQVQDQKIPAGSAVFYTTTYSPSGYKTTQKVVKATSIIGIVFVVPFVVAGLGMIAGGVALHANVDREGGIFLMGFGVLWTVMSVFILITQIVNVLKARKREAEQSSDAPVSNPVSKTPASPVMPSQPETKQEFDPQFFQPSKSSIEDDDEDYKRMKRKGFE